MTDPASAPSPGRPAGAVYDWYQRGLELLSGGDAAAAVQLLAHAATAAPEARSVQEALGRAQFESGQLPEAQETFAALVSADPTDHYARFGLGLTYRRRRQLTEAVEQFALAVAMRPDNRDYAEALRQTRATLAARR